MTCDDKGVTFKAYTDINCAAEKPDIDVNAPWEKCTKVGEDYMMITGASALKAAAIALVAFAGSQFWSFNNFHKYFHVIHLIWANKLSDLYNIEAIFCFID